MDGRYYSLRGSVIDSKSARTQITAVSCDVKDGLVFGYDRNHTRRVIQIEDGIVRDPKMSEQIYCEDQELVMQLFADDDFSEISRRIAGFRERPLLPLQPAQIRLIVALASQQVSADDLTQGLRSLGINLPYKIMKNYLGGYQIKGSNESLSVEDLLDDVMTAE